MCGVHRLYVGKYLTGAIWFFTLGLLFIGQFVDLFYISDMVDRANGEFVPAGRRRRRPPRIPGRDGHSKRCPECAERIQAGARTCRFCGADLTVPRDLKSDDYTICSCPECEDILEVPNHLLGVPGKCEHGGQTVDPVPPAENHRRRIASPEGARYTSPGERVPAPRDQAKNRHIHRAPKGRSIPAQGNAYRRPGTKRKAVTSIEPRRGAPYQPTAKRCALSDQTVTSIEPRRGALYQPRATPWVIGRTKSWSPVRAS